MKKKLLILVSAMLLLFGSALTVSAEEKMATSTAVVRSLETLELYYEDLALWRDGDTILKGGNRDEYNFFAKLNSSFYGCYIKNDEKSTEEKFFYELYAYDYGESVFVEPVLPDMTGCNRYKQYRIYEDGTEKLVQDTTAGGITYVSLRVKDVDSKGWRHFSQMNSLRSNIPFFNSVESAKKYFANGDTSGIINDWYDNMISDESFGLTGFDADNTITATWTGTTHDNVISTYNKAKVGIRPAYSLKSYPGQIASVKSVLQEYDISNKSFTKLYSELAPSDTDLFLRYLEVIPNYQKEPMGEMYVGKSCFIWFKADGSIEKVENNIHDDYPEIFDDASFELRDVNVKNGPTSYITGELSHKISWSGSNKDSIIETIPLDKTYVSVFFYGGSSDGSMKLYDYETSYKHSTVLRIHETDKYNGNSFEFMTQQMIDICEGENRTFMGEVWLTPYYTIDNCIYKGKISVVNVLNGQVGELDPEKPDEPVYPDIPDIPIEEPVIPDFDNIGDISEVIPWFLDIINFFTNGVGQVPLFLSYLFPFLPKELSYMLSFSILVLIILRIVGR